MGFPGQGFNFFIEILLGQKSFQMQSLQPGWVGAAAGILLLMRLLHDQKFQLCTHRLSVHSK